MLPAWGKLCSSWSGIASLSGIIPVCAAARPVRAGLEVPKLRPGKLFVIEM